MSQMLYVQDETGTRSRVRRMVVEPEAATPNAQATSVYQLEDGSPVRRVDNETFQVIATGAYIHVVRE